MKEENKNVNKVKNEHISAFEPQIIGIGVLLAVLSAIICMQIIGKVGVTPNTSLIGAIFAMLLARIPLASMTKFRSLERQNLLQTIVSGAGFSAANCGFIAVCRGESQSVFYTESARPNISCRWRSDVS